MSTARRSASKPDERTEGQGDREIEVLNRQRLFSVNLGAAAGLSRAVLDRVGQEDAVLTITFIRDRTMRRLNRDYRGMDKPTDVLSFAYHEAEDGIAEPGAQRHLGDVVISVETAARYAGELGLTFGREIEHLVIHGALHLAGYDHETDDGQMNRLEKRLRKALLR
jgi:probable rRNA maturation factor